MRSKLVLLAALISALLVGCSQDKDSDKDKQKGKMNDTFRIAPNAQQLQILDQKGNPVANAEVLIGQKPNDPFIDNELKSDANGLVELPTSWTSATTVTIRKAGFLTVSYLNQMPGQKQFFEVVPAPTTQNIELSGIGTGFTIKDKDGIVDFAAMIKALEYKDLIDLSVTKLISPESDVIKVAGNTVNIPSNVSLPKQKETYFIGITLEKPKYRIYFDDLGTKYVYTFRGQFPVKKVIDEFRDDKPLHELINYFTIQGGSLKTVGLTSQKNEVNLPVNELVFQDKLQVKSPQLTGTEVFLGVALSPYQNLFLPTDMKNFKSMETIGLATTGGEQPTVVTLLTRSELEKKLPRSTSTTISTQFTGEYSQLPLINDIRVNARGEYSTKAPTLSQNLIAKGMVSTLYDLEITTVDNEEVRKLTPKWVVYGADWSNDIQMPVWDISTEQKPIRKQMWEVQFLASKDQKSIDLGPRLLESVTHATRVKVDF